MKHTRLMVREGAQALRDYRETAGASFERWSDEHAAELVLAAAMRTLNESRSPDIEGPRSAPITREQVAEVERLSGIKGEGDDPPERGLEAERDPDRAPVAEGRVLVREPDESYEDFGKRCDREREKLREAKLAGQGDSGDALKRATAVWGTTAQDGDTSS